MSDVLTTRRLLNPDYFIPLDVRGVNVPGDKVRWRVEVDVNELTLPDDVVFTDNYFCEVLQIVIDETKRDGLVSIYD